MHLKKILGASLRFVGLLLAIAPSVTAQTAHSPGTWSGRTVRHLELSSDGPLTQITREDLFKLIEIRPGQPYSTSRSRQTLQRLHATGIFHDIQISLREAGPGQVDVSLLLIRRYLVGQLRFQGNLEIPQKQLRRAPTLRSGRPYKSDQLEESIARLKATYQRYGFFQATPAPEFKLDQERAELDITFRIEAGVQARVGEMRLDLEHNVENEQLLSLIESQPGRPYSEIQQQEDIKRLEMHLALQGYLEPLVYLRDGPQYLPQENVVNLVFRVVPRNRTDIRVVGLDWKPQELANLSLFKQGSGVEVFLQDSVTEILEKLQKEGYYLATVDYERKQEDGSQAPIVLRVEKGEKQKLSAIRFEGNQFADSATLRTLVSLKEAGWLGRGRFTSSRAQQDRDRIVSFYQQQGFLDAEVDFSLESLQPGKLEAVFRIVENARYQVADVSIIGVSQLDGALVRGEIQTHAGDPFSPLQVAQDRTAIAALYENRGFRQVELRSELDRLPGQRVAVRYFVIEGERAFVDEVVVTGHRRTREKVIRREVQLQAGEPLSLESSLETEANLYGLTVFNRVQVEEVPSFKDKANRLAVVRLEEAKRFTLLYGIGYSSFEGPRGTFGITNNNFLGQARSVSLGVRLGQRRQRGNLSYSVPRMSRWRLPTVFSLSVDNEQAQTRSRGNTRAIRGRPFDAFTLGASVQSEKRLSRRESLFFRYQFERTQLTIPTNLAAPLEFFREEERLRLSTLGLSYLNDSRDNASDPQRGFFLSGDFSLAARLLGSDEQLARAFLQGQYYRQLSPRVVWASALRVGLIGTYGSSQRVPINQRFFSGGASTLRGLPQDLAGPLLRDDSGAIVLVDDQGNPDPNGRPVPLGGNALMIFNTELRFPIWKLLRGALFYDTGNVFRQLGDFSFRDLSHAVGMGFHLSTPVGPLRFDIGYNPNPPGVVGFRHFNFHFTLGHPF